MQSRCGVMLISALMLVPPAHAQNTEATAVVQRLDDALLAVLKDGDALGYDGRFKELQPVMQQTFDFDYMAEKSLGPQWAQLSAADQARWRKLFAEFTVANYAANFDRFTGQRFEMLGEEASTSGTRLVKTKVISPGVDDVVLTYRLQKASGSWRIIDVFLKGTVSELALRRADFSSVLQRDGFAALARMVSGKVADLAAGRAKRERP